MLMKHYLYLHIITMGQSAAIVASTVISILIVLNYAGLKGVVKIKTGLITPVSPMPTGVQ